MGGGMEAHKNRWIEDWSTARENLEHNFRWTRRNFALVGIFGIALPVLVYKGIVREFSMITISITIVVPYCLVETIVDYTTITVQEMQIALS
ncbi:Pre T-cell antigen receptor alpha [Dorcoceras hygrometricum]|uniref:Pre T-cell antigen receptor alpha n=1 Tax=Dorcoceras hygrometricum TaxID=472368 RepID=A0A2Z7BLR4_9LAMI|nr:Pre T-cell antigen receptor alpha [Dorcoceras hygrometricum]